MNRCCAFLVLAAGAVGCATPSPWPSYEAAVRCHLDGKKNECDAEYQKAIKIDPKTQGLHASYGTHLLLTGRMQEAEKEFAIESKNYPTFAPVAIGRLSAKAPAVASETPPAEAAAPAPEAPAAVTAPATAPSAENKPAPKAGSKKGGAR